MGNSITKHKLDLIRREKQGETAMYCPDCKEPLEEKALFCGNCGKQVGPLYAQGPTIASDAANRRQDQAWHGPVQERYPSNSGSGTPGVPGFSPTPNASYIPSVPTQISPTASTYSSRSYGTTPPNTGYMPTPPSFAPHAPYPPLAHRRSPRNIVFIAIVLALLVVGISAGAITLLQQKHAATSSSTTATAPPTGQAKGFVTFSDSQPGQGNTDHLSISVSGLNRPPSGSHYNAWIVNEQSEQTLPLGTLAAQDQVEQTGQSFALSTSSKGTNLLGAGNRLEITQETGNTSLPSGRVLLTGSFPALAFIHIKHLLVSFPTTPGNIGLLVGLREQARLLADAGQTLQDNPSNKIAVQCQAQSMINLIEGRHDQPTRALQAGCKSLKMTVSGDGFGLLGQNNNGYVSTAAAHASLAATQSDSTAIIKQHSQHVLIATDNLKQWLTTLDHDAHNLLATPGNTALLSQITLLTNHVFNGVDTNDDGSVDPVAGEAGATTAYQHAQLMATLTLTPGP